MNIQMVPNTTNRLERFANALRRAPKTTRPQLCHAKIHSVSLAKEMKPSAPSTSTTNSAMVKKPTGTI
jgi:hypothetical protein